MSTLAMSTCHDCDGDVIVDSGWEALTDGRGLLYGYVCEDCKEQRQESWGWRNT
jgi:hypothetical protein